jgi:hypothetical protein
VRTKVFHAVTPTFGFGPTPSFPDEYALVAEVETDDADRAWHLTQHIESSWLDNDGVHPEPGQHRSSAVGDVMVTPDGKRWLCENIGWSEF